MCHCAPVYVCVYFTGACVSECVCLRGCARGNVCLCSCECTCVYVCVRARACANMCVRVARVRVCGRARVAACACVRDKPCYASFYPRIYVIANMKHSLIINNKN